MKNIYLLLILVLSPLFVAGQAAGDYRSNVATGDWSNPASWQTFDGASWVTAVTAPSEIDGVITIRSGHTISITSDVSIDDTFVDTGATLQLNSGINLFFPAFLFMDVLTVNGTFNNRGIFNTGMFSNIQVNGTFSNFDGSSVIDAAPDYFFFNAGSTYNHRNATTAGEIPLAAWDVTSTCLISGYTTNSTPPTNLNQVFGNFTWGVASYNGAAAFINLGAALTNVAGDLRVTATGATAAKALRFASSSSGFTLNIGGSLRFDAGTIQVIASTSTPTIFNVSGDYTHGTANVVLTQTTGDITINVGGNFTKTAGVLAKTGSGITVFNFNGGGLATQNYTYAGTVISSAINFSIENGSSLNLIGENAITGSGTFTLNAGATMSVGSVNGLATGTGVGNIRTSTTRNYQANGNIVYNGVTQNLGNEWSSSGALNGVAVNLQITNGAVVNNNNIGSTSLVGILSLTNGTLNIGNSNTITIQGVFISTTNGLIGGGTTSNLSFAGAGAMGSLNLAPAANSLNTLTVGRTGTLVLGTDLTVNNLNLSFGSLNFNNRTLTINGASISSAGGTGLRSNNNSNLVFGGSTFSGAVPFSGGGNQLNDLTFSTPGGVFNWNSNVTILNRVELTAGTINHTSGLTMGSNSTFSRSGGTVALNSPDVVTRYSVEYTGGVTTGLELPATPTELNNLTVNSSGPVLLDKDITINGNVNLLGSTFGANGFDVTLASTSGTWTRNGGGFIGGSGILTVAGNITIVAPSSAPNYTNITVNSGASLTLPTGNLNIGGNIVNNGTINRSTSTTNFNNNTTISGSSATTLNNVAVSGTLIAPSATTLGIAGNFTNTGTFNHNNGTVAFSGTTAILGSQASNFFHVNLTGTLTAPSVTQLGIAGDLTNSGTFNHNNGTILFNGTVAAQTVSGSALTVNNIRVSNPVTPGVRINNTTRLNGICTLIGGAYFDADGTGSGVFIVSSSSQTTGGRIAALPTPANFTGLVTIERYVHGKTGGDYRYMSMPITTNANVGVWRNSMFVTGNFSDRNTNADNANIANSGNTNPSVYTYNSTTSAFVGVSGGGGLTTATAVSSRLGYSVYDFNNGPVTISYRGLPEKGSVPISISNTATRFNLVPNPYPSPIDWDNVTKTNVTDAMYLRIDNNVFSSYVGGVSTNAPFVGWSGEVATGQAFFVVSSGTGSTFTLTEASKSNNAFYFLREQTPRDFFRVKLLTSNDAHDEVVIRFADGATDQFDNEYDAPKMWNKGDLFPFNAAVSSFVNMATYLNSPEDAYSINSIGILKGVKIVNMTISDIPVGKNHLSFSDLENLTQSYNVVLVDKYLNREFDVTDGYSHEFTVDKNLASQGSSRFHLRINGDRAGNITPEPLNGMKLYPNPVVDELKIELTQEQQDALTSVSLIDMLGVPVVDSEHDKALLNPGVKTINMRSFKSGVYLLSVKSGGTVSIIRILKR